MKCGNFSVVRKYVRNQVAFSVAFETSLGWVLSGPVEEKYDPKLLSATNFVETHVLFTGRESNEE